MSFLKKLGGISISSLVIYGGIQNFHNFSRYFDNDYQLNQKTQNRIDGIKSNIDIVYEKINNIYSMMETTSNDDIKP